MLNNSSQPKVAYLDAGAQSGGVIQRRIGEQGYKADHFPVNVRAGELAGYDAIVISGGPRSVNYSDPTELPDPDIWKLGLPTLGICLGQQIMAKQNGGTVVRGERGQYGRSQINISKREGIFQDLGEHERVLMSHFDRVERVPEGFEVYARSEGMIAAMGNKERRLYATQFHPELLPITKNGDKMFENFFRHVCNFPEAEKRTVEQDIATAEKIIQEAVGSNKHVMHYLSWGVDSTVMALLLRNVVEPDRLHMRTLDILRIGELEDAVMMAKELRLPDFAIMDVRERFYSARREIETINGKITAGPLYSVTDPEHKRKIFGTEYAEIALEEMRRIAEEKGIPIEDFLLGQGTLFPDVIESAKKKVTKGKAHVIKTHHNAVRRLDDVLKVEPLIHLFKDQVRPMGIELGLPEELAYKQPFPGPGEIPRIICVKDQAIEGSYFDINKRVEEVARKRGFNAHALPIKTVGVQGDERGYKHPVVVSGENDWHEFAKLSRDLPNEIEGINRVTYVSGEPLTSEDALSITPTLLSRDVRKQWRTGDYVMRTAAESYGFNDSRRCSQMPGIIIPSSFGKDGQRAFVVRPVLTHDFMAIIGMMPYSGSPPEEDPEEYFPEEMFLEMAERIPKEVEGISRVILDPTDKPPGSTEWE